MREDKDRSAKWLLEHHGGAALRLGGVTGFSACRAVQAEVVHPRQLPDGLLEVTFPGRAGPDLYVVEVTTYPDRRAEEEAARDAMLVFLDRGVVPEVLTLVLRQRGNVRLTGDWQLGSGGRTLLSCRSRVIELWMLSAEELLATGDVGVVPWVPLAGTTEPPDALLRRCRERIEEQARPEEQANLIAVTQVMAHLRYNDPALLAIIGGRPMILESPLIQELWEEKERDILHRMILQILEKRFGAVPEALAAQVRAVQALERLNELPSHAAVCPDLEAFRARLPA
jgi:hypothetical protein